MVDWPKLSAASPPMDNAEGYIKIETLQLRLAIFNRK